MTLLVPTQWKGSCFAWSLRIARCLGTSSTNLTLSFFDIQESFVFAAYEFGLSKPVCPVPCWWVILSSFADNSAWTKLTRCNHWTFCLWVWSGTVVKSFNEALYLNLSLWYCILNILTSVAYCTLEKYLRMLKVLFLKYGNMLWDREWQIYLMLLLMNCSEFQARRIWQVCCRKSCTCADAGNEQAISSNQ